MRLSIPAGGLSRIMVTGVVGAAAYDLIKRTVERVDTHSLAVTGTSWGLRGVRASEVKAEQARLKVADLVAEAKARNGEQSLPPTATSVPHEH